MESFCTEAASSGVDGLIVVDVPPEEADEIEPAAKANGLDLIRLIAPTTDDARLPRVLAASSGFVYYVAITGITGTRSATGADLAAAIRASAGHRPAVAIGFGVRNAGAEAESSRLADARVASALIDTLGRASTSRGAPAGPACARCGQGARAGEAVRGVKSAAEACREVRRISIARSGQASTETKLERLHRACP